MIFAVLPFVAFVLLHFEGYHCCCCCCGSCRGAERTVVCRVIPVAITSRWMRQSPLLSHIFRGPSSDKSTLHSIQHSLRWSALPAQVRGTPLETANDVVPPLGHITRPRYRVLVDEFSYLERMFRHWGCPGATKIHDGVKHLAISLLSSISSGPSRGPRRVLVRTQNVNIYLHLTPPDRFRLPTVIRMRSTSQKSTTLRPRLRAPSELTRWLPSAFYTCSQSTNPRIRNTLLTYSGIEEIIVYYLSCFSSCSNTNRTSVDDNEYITELHFFRIIFIYIRYPSLLLLFKYPFENCFFFLPARSEWTEESIRRLCLSNPWTKILLRDRLGSQMFLYSMRIWCSWAVRLCPSLWIESGCKTVTTQSLCGRWTKPHPPTLRLLMRNCRKFYTSPEFLIKLKRIILDDYESKMWRCISGNYNAY